MIADNNQCFGLNNGVLVVDLVGRFTFREGASGKCKHRLTCHYDASATSPTWDAYLKRVVPDRGDRDAIEEFIGYCLLPSHKYESFLYLYGKHGKSVILETMRSLFGSNNVSHLDTDELVGWHSHALNNKILNCGISSNYMDKDTIVVLKKMVSPYDCISVKSKNREPYMMSSENKPKCVFYSNKKCKSISDDESLRRRAIVIRFDEEIHDDEKIRDLVERFEDEKAGILNVALRGLTRLVKNGDFSIRNERTRLTKKSKPSMYKIMNGRIREDWGTVKNFAKQNGFNNNTVKVVLQGAGKSRFITDRLIELGYLGHADELIAHTKKQKD